MMLLTIPGHQAASPLPFTLSSGRHPDVSARTAPGFRLAGKATPPERRMKVEQAPVSRTVATD